MRSLGRAVSGPAARAEAVSPPAAVIAREMLLAPNTATGLSTMLRRRRVGVRERLAVGLRGVDPHVQEVALPQHAQEQAQPAGRAGAPTLVPPTRQAGLGHAAGDEGVTSPEDGLGDG